MSVKKLILFTIAAALLFTLAACAEIAGTETDSPPPPSPSEAIAVGETPDVSAAVATPPPESVPPAEEWKTVFTTFLSENYDKISEICFGGVAGVGFIDLDLDGEGELILFDAGASASMGVQLFDIAEDGVVYCVSANISELLNYYGGGNSSNLSVNANFFDDFRLMEDVESGERFFIVESGNGAEDFSYLELIRFERKNGMLNPRSLLYKYEEYELDTESDEKAVIFTIFSRGGDEIGADEFEAEREAFFGSCIEIDYTPAGVFIWEDKSYDGSAESFMRLVESAIKKYEPLAVS